MLKLFVVEHKIISYDYFMDELQQYEQLTLSKLLPWSEKQSKEQMRMLLWAALFGKIKGKKTPDKLFPLYTDKHNPYGEHEETLANDEADKIRAKIVTADWKKFQHKKY